MEGPFLAALCVSIVHSSAKAVRNIERHVRELVLQLGFPD